MKAPSAIAVIPVLDEAATIDRVVAGARAHVPVLVVDDGSSDGSGDVAARAGADVLRHPRRRGKAQALRTGIAAARARGAALVATLDGDGQHDPDDLPALLEVARRAPRAIVVGSRLGGDARRLPPDRLNAIRIAGFFANWASGLRVADTQSGYRVYPAALFDEVVVSFRGFVFETEVLLAAWVRGWDVREVPVAALPRAARRSRFRPVRDGGAVGLYLASCALARWRAELGAAAGEVAAVFSRARRCERHAAMLTAAARWADSPGAWAWALGACAARRAAAGVAGWWRHPRRRRAAVAAGATLATPAVLPFVLLQALAPWRRPDPLTPLVAALYAQERLDVGGAPPPVTLAAGGGLATPLAPPR